MDIAFAPAFVRQYKHLPTGLQLEVKEKIALFRDPKNHRALKVHKLTGNLKEQFAFSVNYKTRIVFWYAKSKPKEAILVAVGDHDVYDR
jgi:plasmid maintenance system killer protein